MTHPTNEDCRLHGALEQDRRERDWDRDWGAVEALRETRHLGPVVASLLIAAIGVYIGAWMASNGDIVPGLSLGAGSLIGGGLWLDTDLCKGTPAHVHECRRCRRETDRWRGPTRDDLRVTSLVGQQSAAERTPQPDRYRQPPTPKPRTWDGEPEPAVRPVTEPRPEPGGAELFETVKAYDEQPEALEDLPPELREDLEERLGALAETLSPEEFASALSVDEADRAEPDAAEIRIQRLDGGAGD